MQQDSTVGLTTSHGKAAVLFILAFDLNLIVWWHEKDRTLPRQSSSLGQQVVSNALSSSIWCCEGSSMEILMILVGGDAESNFSSSFQD